MVPVSLAPIEAEATPEPLPVTLTKGDIIVGAAGADVDADGDEDVLLSIQDDVGLRVVALLQEEDDTTFVEGETVSFETAGDAAQVRRFGDGSLELVSRLDSGSLFVAVGLGDGSFAAPVPSAWATEPLSAFAVGALDQLGVGVDVNTLLLSGDESAALGSTVSDVDGDGRSDVIALHEDGHLTVVFAASTGGACTQIVETGAVFDAIHRPSSGERQGVVLSGAEGVLAVRAVAD